MEEVRLNHLLLNLNYKSMEEENPLYWGAANLQRNNENKTNANPQFSKETTKLIAPEGLSFCFLGNIYYYDYREKPNPYLALKTNLKEKYGLKLYVKGKPLQEIKDINFYLKGDLSSEEREFLINKLKGFYKVAYVFIDRCYSIKHYYSNFSYLDIVWNYSTMFKFLQLSIDSGSDSDDYADKIIRSTKMGVKITHPK